MQTRVEPIVEETSPLISYQDRVDISRFMQVIVVNGLPFCLGSEEPKLSWAPQMWVPFTGLNRDGAVPPFGDYLFHNRIHDILESVFNEKLSKDNHPTHNRIIQDFFGEGIPYADLINLVDDLDVSHDDISDEESNILQFITKIGRFIFKSTPAEEMHDAKITLNGVLDKLSSELSKFGSMEALIISMKLEPGFWQINPIMGEFMEKVIRLHPEYGFYNSVVINESWQRVDGNTIVLFTKEDMNQTLYELVNKPYMKSPARISRPDPVTRKTEFSLLGIGTSAGVTGGLILGNVLNIGLLAGVGGTVLASLTTVAAATGFGLIALGVVAMAIIAICLYKKHHKQPSLHAIQFQEEETKLAVVHHLQENSRNEVRENLTRGLPKVQVFNNTNTSSFFSPLRKILSRGTAAVEPESSTSPTPGHSGSHQE